MFGRAIRPKEEIASHFSHMKSENSLVLFTAWIVLGGSLMGCHVNFTTVSRGPNPHLKLSLNSESSGGSWRSSGGLFPPGRELWLNLSVQDETSTWLTGFNVAASKLALVPEKKPRASSGPVKFILQSEGGAFRFAGEGTEREAAGNFQFEGAPSFMQRVEPLLAEKPEVKDWLLFALSEVTADYVAEIKAAGYAITARDVLRLRRSGVPAEHLTALHKGGCNYSIEDIIRFRHAGIGADHPVELKKAGYALSAEEIVRLRRAGVPSEYFIKTKGADLSLSAEQIVRLRHAGVSADSFHDFKEAQANLSSEEIIRLRHAGISPEYFASWKSFSFTSEEIIKMRNAGVPTEYATALKESGYSPTTDDIIRLRNAGIVPEFFTAAKKAGYDFTPNELIRLRQAGVTPEYLAGLHIPGQRNLSADVMIDLRRRGIPVKTVKQIRSSAN